LEQSRAQRILWLLEECNVPYELKVYKRGLKVAGKDLPLAPKELREIHPLGKSPLITVVRKSGPPVVIAESAFIIEYLSDRFGKHLIPARFGNGGSDDGDETEEWLRYRYFMHYSEGSLFFPLMIGLFLYRMYLCPFP
jgi:glutathione S-transferase